MPWLQVVLFTKFLTAEIERLYIQYTPLKKDRNGR